MYVQLINNETYCVNVESYHLTTSTTEDVDHFNLYVEGACLSGVKETTQDVLVSATRIII